MNLLKVQADPRARLSLSRPTSPLSLSLAMIVTELTKVLGIKIPGQSRSSLRFRWSGRA